MRIIPLHCGFLKMDKSGLTFAMNQGVKVDVPSYIWYIEGSESKIILDTSYSDPELMSKWHYPCTRKPENEVVNALKSVGLKPEDIDIVVMTHLHWDHSGNTNLFRNASILIRREEVAYAIAPLGIHSVFYDAPTIGRTPAWLNTKFEFVSGDKEIAKGVSVFFTPGHTPGHQSVAVETEEGRYVIAGDAIPLYENLNGTPYSKYIAAVHVNAQQWWDSAERIMDRAAQIKRRVLPGHDIEVLKKKSYP